MFDLSRVQAALTVGESIAELVGAVADHLRGKSAVDWKPALREIEAAMPEIITAVRSGTAAEDEDGSLAGDGDRGAAADDAAEAAAAGDGDPELHPGEDEGEAAAEQDDADAADGQVEEANAEENSGEAAPEQQASDSGK